MQGKGLQMEGISYIQALCGTDKVINGAQYLILPFLLLLAMYVIAVSKQNKGWPLHRTFLFLCGVLCVCLSVSGAVAILSHIDFRVHMFSHLLLGMVAPLCIVIAAPMTLFLRTLPVSGARCLSAILKSSPSRFLTNPFVAAFLNIGGLWLLYTSSLYDHMHKFAWIHFLVHFHLFMAGYLFTFSIIPNDPTPHRVSFRSRAIVLVLALAGHGILAKYLYVHPPPGVSISQGQTGGKMMYYGGDVIEVVIIYLLCQRWLRPSRRYIRKDDRIKGLLQ
jgi:putative membrane protein